VRNGKILAFSREGEAKPGFLWAFNKIFGFDRCAAGMDTSIYTVEINLLCEGCHNYLGVIKVSVPVLELLSVMVLLPREFNVPPVPL